MHSTYELQIGQFTQQSVSNKNISKNISDRHISGSIMCDSYDSIVYHMEKKYLCDQDVESFIDIFGTSPCKVATEKGLELLVLDRKNISHVGDVDRFASFVQNVSELDLSWNNIKSWSTVSTLLETMPSLKMLNLSHNPIEKSDCNSPPCFNTDEEGKNEDFLADLKESSRCTIEQDMGSSCDSCSPPSTSSSISSTAESNSLSMLVMHQNARRVTPKLSTVILNGVNLSLQSIQQFVSAFPQLTELHLAENTFDPNEIATIDAFSPFSTSVRVLNLNACELTEWNTVLRLLKCFPNTAYLYLGDNKLEHIEVDCNGLHTEQVCWALQSITLSGNNLGTWKSIENLSFMRRLEELRVRNIPLFNDCAEEERHHLIIGRLRSLTSLNGSTITPLQREESERFFIRYYQNLNEKPIVYPDLVAEHGNLEQLVKIDLTPRRFAKVILRCDETNYSATARIRLSGTVIELMRYAEKMTGIPTPKMRLFYFDVNVSGCGPTELRFPNQVLQSLHIEDGDEFIIQAKHVNPVNYNRVMDFWKGVICDYCKHEKTCLFSLEELKQKLRRGTQIPSPLNLVLQEMQQSNQLQTQTEYNKKNLGWLEWGFSFLQPTSWFSDNGEKHKTVEKFVHFAALKQMADDLLRYYHDEYQMVDCPEVVEFCELKTSVSHIVRSECFDLVVSELVGRGEVSVGKSRFGDKVLKFKDQSTKGPAQFTDVDASVHELRKTMIRLEGEIRKSEERMLKFQDQARLVYKKGDKKTALQLMKKKKRVEEEIANKDKQYQNLLVMLQQVAQSKQTREIIDIYKESSAAFKAALSRQGLTVETVDTTMDNVHEALSDAHEMEEALREGFRNLPAANESIGDEDLESELNELLAENGDGPLAAGNGQSAVHETASDLEPNKVRIGKRVLDLADLPDVPNSTPSLAQKKARQNADSLDERWRRLRAE